MTLEQKRHLAEGQELWRAYGPLLQRKRRLVGGLQWKTVAGNEYLYRFQPDPITKQKRSTSVGRRGPETEALYQTFIAERERLREEAARLEARLESYRRVSKALRLNRLNSDAAQVLQTVWEDNLQDHLLAFGETAIDAYEAYYGEFLRGAGEADQELTFVVPGDEDFVDVLVSSLRRIDRSYELIGNAITGDQGPRVWIFEKAQIARLASEHLGDDDCEMFAELLDLPTPPVVAISKAGSPVPLTAVHPIAHAIWGMLGGDESDRPRKLASLALDSDVSDMRPSDLLSSVFAQSPIAMRH